MQGRSPETWWSTINLINDCQSFKLSQNSFLARFIIQICTRMEWNTTKKNKTLIKWLKGQQDQNRSETSPKKGKIEKNKPNLRDDHKS